MCWPVTKAYEDFAKGDVPAVLAVLDEDVQWVVNRIVVGKVDVDPSHLTKGG